MDEKDFEEIFQKLEEQGWNPQLCDTPVPYYDNPVKCGLPTGVGDVVEGKKMFPRNFLSMQPEFVVTVQGDSMKDVNIMDGDAVNVQSNAHIHDGDVVLVMIDDEFTVKTYCEDEEGRPWLVPQNDEYEAFPLMESEDTWILGLVKEVIKAAPRVTARACMKLIRKAKIKEPPALTQRQVEETIVTVAPMVKNGRQWYAVYRPMADRNVVREGDFEGFCKMIREEVPKHEHLPTPVEMQRLAVQSFAKSVRQWLPGNAPVTGKRYKDYLEIARKTDELLTT